MSNVDQLMLTIGFLGKQNEADLSFITETSVLDYIKKLEANAADPISLSVLLEKSDKDLT